MLTIKGYDKDLNTGVIYGWDLAKAFERDEDYIFIFNNRNEDYSPVTARINRESKLDPFSFSIGWECKVYSVGGGWSDSYFIKRDELIRRDGLYTIVENSIYQRS